MVQPIFNVSFLVCAVIKRVKYFKRTIPVLTLPLSLCQCVKNMRHSERARATNIFTIIIQNYCNKRANMYLYTKNDDRFSKNNKILV